MVKFTKFYILKKNFSSAFEYDFKLFEVKKISNWHCGLQSFDISPDGKCILIKNYNNLEIF